MNVQFTKTNPYWETLRDSVVCIKCNKQLKCILMFELRGVSAHSKCPFCGYFGPYRESVVLRKNNI